jgi:hypothetical protein
MASSSKSVEAYSLAFDREFPPQKRTKMAKEEKEADAVSLTGFSQDFISFELEMIVDEQDQVKKATKGKIVAPRNEARKITVLSEIIIPAPSRYNGGLFHLVNYGASSSSSVRRTADVGVQTDGPVAKNIETQTDSLDQDVSIFFIF